MYPIMGRPFTVHLSLGQAHHERLRLLAAHYGITHTEAMRRVIDEAFRAIWPDMGRPGPQLPAPPRTWRT